MVSIGFLEFFFYSFSMFKYVNFLAIFVFILFSSVAPHMSVKTTALNFTESPEERDFSNQAFEEEIAHFLAHSILIVASDELDFVFPPYISLKSQSVYQEILKPPLS